MIHTTEFKAMGCRIFAAVDAPVGSPVVELEDLPNLFEGWEHNFSRFRSDSELNEVNRSAGRIIHVSKPFWDVLKVAERAEHDSNNLVTPAIHDQLMAAGYDRSFDQMPDSITESTEQGPGKVYPISALRFGLNARSIQLPDECHLDLGGVAKGWAAHQAARRLRQHGATLVNAGGDISITGRMSGGKYWSVGVSNPDDPSKNLEILKLGRCGIATSGIDYRHWMKAHTWQHHIIDPRTGFPAITDVLSATIIAPDVMEAEMNAKMSVILGSDLALKWLDGNPFLAGILVLKSGRVIKSQTMEKYLWRNK
jgi:thiamine biosynthesis lipoprotein